MTTTNVLFSNKNWTIEQMNNEEIKIIHNEIDVSVVSVEIDKTLSITRGKQILLNSSYYYLPSYIIAKTLVLFNKHMKQA